MRLDEIKLKISKTEYNSVIKSGNELGNKLLSAKGGIRYWAENRLLSTFGKIHNSEDNSEKEKQIKYWIKEYVFICSQVNLKPINLIFNSDYEIQIETICIILSCVIDTWCLTDFIKQIRKNE